VEGGERGCVFAGLTVWWPGVINPELVQGHIYGLCGKAYGTTKEASGGSES